MHKSRKHKHSKPLSSIVVGFVVAGLALATLVALFALKHRPDPSTSSAAGNVTVDKSSYKPGDTVRFNFVGFPASTQVAVCLNGGGCNKLSGDANTTASGSATVTKIIASAATAGTYEYEAYYHDPGSRCIGCTSLWGKVSVTVTGGTSGVSNPKFAVSPNSGTVTTTTVKGTVFTFTVTGAGANAQICFKDNNGPCQGSFTADGNGFLEKEFTENVVGTHLYSAQVNGTTLSNAVSVTVTGSGGGGPTGTKKVAADKPSYKPGETVRFNFIGFPGDTQVAVCLNGGGCNKLSGDAIITSSGSATVTKAITSSTAAGTYEYEAYYHEPGSKCLGCTELWGKISVTVAGTALASGPTGEVDKSSVKAGAQFTLTFKNIPANDRVYITYPAGLIGESESTTVSTVGSSGQISVGPKTVYATAKDAAYTITWKHGFSGCTSCNPGNPLTVTVGAGSAPPGGGNPSGIQFTVTPNPVVFGNEAEKIVTFKLAKVPIVPGRERVFCIHESGKSCNGGDWDPDSETSQAGRLDADGNGTIQFPFYKASTQPGKHTYVVSFEPPLATTNQPPKVEIEFKESSGGGGGGGGGTSDPCEKVGRDPWPKVTDQQEAAGTNNKDAVNCIKSLLNTIYSKDPSTDLPLDGKYDARTIDLIKEFQDQYDLQVDGDVWTETWPMLFSVATGDENPPKPGDKPPGDKPPGGGGKTITDDGSNPSCASEGLVAQNGLCLPPQTIKGEGGLVNCGTLTDCLNTIIRILLTFAGVIAVLFIIIGGFRYITSAGNEEQATSGKKTLLYAVIGLGAVILAFTIVTIVSKFITGGK